MSRVGKKPISVPAGVEVKIENEAVIVKGPKGELKQELHPRIKVAKDEEGIKVNVDSTKDKFGRSLWGLFRNLIKNMVLGVTVGFEKKLEINGVGYRVALQGGKVILNVGFSHPVEYSLPKGISAAVEKNVITISGIDKQLVGEVAAQIRSVRKPEPYKGKGIKYIDEVIRRKSGKQAKASE